MVIAERIPFQVYLDTADYSTLSNPAALDNDPAKVIALEEIRNFLGQGIIEVRFSASIFGEVVHIDSDSKKFAVPRAGLIKEFCKGRTIINPYELFELEVRSSATNQIIARNDVYRDNGDFFGCNLDDAWAKDFRDNAIKEVQEILLKVPNRAKRRQLEAQLIKNGKFRPSSKAFWMNLKESEGDSSDPLYPILQLVMTKERLFQFLLGEITAETFRTEFFGKILDIENLVQHIIDAKTEYREQLYNGLRGNAKKLANALQQSIDNIMENRDKFIQSGHFSLDDFNKKLREIAYSAVSSMRINQTTQWLGLEIASVEAEAKSKEAKMGAYPAFDLFLLLATELMITKATQNSKILPNDIVDIMHASYAPYFDCIRLDRRTAELYKRLPKNLTDQYAVPVSKIEGLKNAISLNNSI